MQMPNEIVVSRLEFLAAVRRVPRGGLRKSNQYTPRTTLIYAHSPILIVETPYVRTEIAAVGRWKQPVAVNARLLITVARRLPKADRITLLYANGRLFFDGLSIEAKPAAGMTPAQAGRLGAIWEPVPQRTATQLSPQGDQLLIPGVMPITDRERLNYLAKAPLRSRRR
jgi:hypothetical protein